MVPSERVKEESVLLEPPCVAAADRSCLQQGFVSHSKLWVNTSCFGCKTLQVAPGFSMARPEYPEGGSGKEQGRRCQGHFWCWPWPGISLESPSRHSRSTAGQRRIPDAWLGTSLGWPQPVGTPPGLGGDGEHWDREPGATIAAPRPVSHHPVQSRDCPWQHFTCSVPQFPRLRSEIMAAENAFFLPSY